MSNKPKAKPTEFPVSIDGKIQWVKKGDYSKAVSSQMAIRYSTDVKKSHIEQMLEAIENGKKNMGDDAPEEFKKIFDTVMENYDSAVEEVERREQEEIDKKAAAERAEKEKEQKEIALFDKVKGTTTDFATLAKAFDTGGDAMDRFVAKGNVSDETLFAAFNASLKMGEFSGWMKGDLVVALEGRGHINVCTRIAEDAGIPFPSIYRMARTAKAVPPDKRVKGVSFTTYSEIANAKLSDKPEEAKTRLTALLADAEEGKFKTALETRAAVKKAQGKEDPVEKLPEEDDKRKFLVFDRDLEQGQDLVIATGFPKELFLNGAIVVDLKTGKKFAENGFKKDAAKRWEDLPAYEKPEAAKATPPAKAAPAAAAPAKKVAKKK